MLRYLDSYVTLAEIPDEISLCINIIDCPIHCKDCSEPWMWNTYKGKYPNGNTPKILNAGEIKNLVEKNDGISCVCFMGGDIDAESINFFAKIVKDISFNKVAWYSGRTELPKYINPSNFDYIKLGPYIKEKGPLNCSDTNQRFYNIYHNWNGVNIMLDHTEIFWK